MGKITINGNVSGKPYTFEIGGEQPTAEDVQFMQSYISQNESQFLQGYQQKYGDFELDEDPGTAIGRGLQRGIPQFQSSLGSALGAVGFEGAEDYLQGAATQRQLDMLGEDPALLEGTDFRDVRGLGSGLTYLGELLGEQLPIIGGTVGATGAGVAAGASLPVSATLATLAVSYPQLFGSNIQRQEGQVRAGELADVDVGKAAAFAAGQVALEAASNAFLAARVPGGVIRSMLENAPVEAVTEVGQQALERQQAGLPVDSEDAYKEYLDAGVAGGALGGLFGAAGGIRSSAQDEPPAETPEPTDDGGGDVQAPAMPDPRRPVTIGTLDELGIPPGAPIRGQFESGALGDGETALAALEQYAANAAQSPGTTDVAARVRDYVAAATEARLSAVQPELDVGGAELPAARVGPQDAVRAGADTAAGAAATPDAGRLDVPEGGTGAITESAGAQQPALTEAEAFELAAQNVPPVVPTNPPEQAAQREGETAPPAPSIKEASAAVRQYMQDNPETRATKADIDEIISELTNTVKTVDEAVVDVLSRSVAKGRPGPKRGAEAEPEPIPGFDEIPEGPDVRGVDPFAEAEVQEQKDITPEEIESRAAAVPETETAEPAESAATAPLAAPPPGLTTAEVERNAIPGRQTGAAGQVIPEGITAELGREPTLQPTFEGETEINAAVNAARMRKSQRDNRADLSAAAEITRRFNDRSSEDLKRYVGTEAASGYYDSTTKQFVPVEAADVTSVSDKQKIIELLDKKFPTRAQTTKNPEWAAHLYFSKHADVSTAIDTIAYDAVAAGVSKRNVTPDMSEGAKQYYRQTGELWGTQAGKWVIDNLDRDARLQLYERIDFYRPRKNDAIQKASAYKTDKAVERDRKYREYMGDQTGDYVGLTPDFETAQELGFGTEDVSDIEAMFSKTAALDMPLHPQVVRAIQANDVNAVIDGLIATSGSPEAQKLAAKLRPFVQDTPLRTFDPVLMADMNEVFGDGRRDSAMGIYMPRYSPEELAEVNARDGNPQRAQLRTEYNGVVALNEQTGMTPSTLLHELIHVATTKTLKNESHPLTRQIETMLTEARKIIPNDTYGLLNRYEFVSEGMSNPAFIQELSQIDTGIGAKKFTLFERFRHALRNFGRQLIGRKAKPLQRETLNQKDALDRMFDDLLATDRNMRGVGELYNQTFQKNGARDIMNSMKNRTVEATPTNMKELRKLARTTAKSLPFGDNIKEFVVRSSMPLRFVVEYAKKYMPSAPELYDTINAHGSEVHRMSVRVEETLMPIRDFLKKNKNKVETFNKARFRATEARVDPRKPRSAYEKFQLAYDEMDADGDFVRRVTMSYNTRKERQDDAARLNADPLAQRVRMTYDPTSEEGIQRKAAYDEVAALYRELGEEGRAALNRAFELPEYFRGEMKRVAKARLEAMLPGQRATQERIYKNVFEKIFAETLIDPYQALQRRGSFGLSYSAIDPSTGDLKVFKHAFESAKLRDQAISLLQSLGDEARVTQIMPYDMDKGGFQIERPSMQFVSAVLNKLDTNGQLGDPGKVNEILELVFEATPETSFVRSYMNRKDVPGYIGDITPLGFNMNMGDTMENIRSNGMHLASKVADTEYQIKLDKLRTKLDEERRQFDQDAMATLSIDERAAATEEAATYQKVLNDFSRAPFRQRANWSRSLTAGGYALTLGFNVSTAAITFFQMPTIIYPYLAGKYGGRESMQSIGLATRILTGSGRERTIERVSPEGGLESVRRKVGFYDFSVSNLDFAKSENGYLKKLFEIADIAGVFNRSLTQDILDETGAKGWVQKTAAYSGLMQHHTERYMRESTLLSTYLLELKKNLPEGKALSMKQFQKAMADGRIRVPDDIAQAAAKEAVYTSDMTNGSILAATAPALSQGNVGSVIYLFKRFPLSMLNMLWHTLSRSIDSTNNKEDRRIAALQFGGMAGSITLLAGASGIPGFHMASALWNLIKEDDDEDLETLIRTGVLGEVGLTGLVDYYAGVSVSSRIGLSGTFYRPGFNTEDQKPLLTLLEGFGGPVVGLFNKYTDRVPYFFQEGEYQRMTEALMPTSIGNAMKSFRFATEGARTLRYDPLIDDIGPFSVGAQFFGFMPTEYARQLAQNSYLRGVDSGINEKRTKLMKQVYIGQKMGDTDTVRRTIAKIQEFNRMYPQAAITPETLSKSLRSHRDTTSRMHHGITFSTKNEPYLKQRASDFGNATAFS